MGWLGNFVAKQTNKLMAKKYAGMMSGATPIFTQFGQNIYASDVVQQCINCIAQEMKKLEPEHIREKGNCDVIPVNSSVAAVLKNPNPLMTTSDFLEKIIWLLFLNFNVFIIPVYYEWKEEDGTVKRKYEALYPIQPSRVDFVEDASGALGVKFYFANGQEFEPIPYDRVIHIRYRYGVNDFMGGNLEGQPDNEALLKTLEINHSLLQGVSSAMKSSFAVNAVVKIKTLFDQGKTEAALEEFEAKLRKSESGLLPLDISADYIPIKKEIQLVDDKTLKFIDEKILRQYGVSLPILIGDYTKEQYEAFYQKTLEPLIIAISQAFTKVLFTERERAHGNKAMFYTKDLIFMSMEQKLQMLQFFQPTGGLFENEKRVIVGMRPLAELEGKRLVSLNYIDATKANEYQLNKKEEGENEQADSNESI